MNVRITSVGNTEDGGWLIEFSRIKGRPLTVVIALPREEGKDPPSLPQAINAGYRELAEHAEDYQGKCVFLPPDVFA